ncbi:GA module-containing protein [Staphylococcus aureus]
MTHLNDAQKQALKGQIDQSPKIATVNQVKQTATSLRSSNGSIITSY